MSAAATDQLAETKFSDLDLSAPLLSAVESSGYTTATPIQARTIPLLLEGRDVLGQAQTGTGKTAAFALPLLQRIDLTNRSPQVLVLTPTRELAIQVGKAFERYAAELGGLHVAAVYGGSDYVAQFRQLDAGPQVVVGTPGRVMDHMRRGSLKLDSLQGLVLDEADEMLNMGFAEDVEWVLTQAPEQRQIALFSATMPPEIRRIAQKYLRNPAEVTIKSAAKTAETVRQRYLVVAPPQKQVTLSRVLEAEEIDAAIVFVKTKNTTEILADYLSSHGHRAAALSSDVVQQQRERIVENLRSGKIDVIVATDVAARGLDVQRISHVINYDFPFDSESYVHRIGRTGRAGRTGDAILFLTTRERHLLRRIEQATRGRIEPMELPSKRAINRRRVAKFHERMTAGLAHSDLATFTSIVEQYRSANPDLPVEQIAAALVGLAVGDKPFLINDELEKTGFREGKSARDGRDFREGRERRPFERCDRPQRGARSEVPMETYRVDVGRVHQVKPGQIVGAIANEAALPSSGIGRIEIFDDFSLVDLLVGMPRETFQVLKRTVVAGRQLNIAKVGDDEGHVERPKKRFGEKSKVGKPKKGRRFATEA